MSTALNPRAVAFTPGGSMEEEAPARTYSLGPHCPWECPVLPPSSPLAIRDVMTRYFQEENVAGRNTVACGHFDERLRIAAEYAFDNGALSVSPLLLDTPKPLQQVCRAIASAISGFATTDATVVTPEMRDAVRQVTVMMPQELLAVLINSCSPLAADEVNPGEWDIAFSCAGSIVHLLAIATLFEKGIASCDAATVERLSSLRDAVLRHRGAGCLVKIALPMLAACRYAANMEGNAKHTYAVRWCRDLFPLALNFIFSLPPVGGLNELVAFSHSHFWSTMDSIPLGAIIVSETLQAYNSMTRLSMGGLVSRPFTGVAMMMTNPTLSHIRPPATRVLEEGHNTPPPPQVVTSPEMASSTAGDGAGTADVTRSPMQLPSMPSSTAADAAATQPSTATPNNSHVPHLLEEVGNHDASLMLAFALLAVTECNAVTVATAKRAVEAVELACDGDPSQLENTISRRPQPVIRDLMMVCESLIGRAPDQGDLLRRASECVLAREHGAAHASSLIIKGAPKASAPAVSPTSSSGPVNAQSAAAARYTRKLPSTTNATSPSSGLPLVSATLGMPTGRPLPRKPSGTKTGDDDFSSGGGWNVTAPPPHQGATW